MTWRNLSELMALQTRLLRQQDLGVDTRVDVSMLIVNTTESARAMSTLMQYCHRVIVQGDLFIEADIGKEGWAALAEGWPRPWYEQQWRPLRLPQTR